MSCSLFATPELLVFNFYRTKHELEKEAGMRVLCHVNIVALLAMILELGHCGVVMELVLYGALGDYVFNHYV